jgi:hypothetical protein
MATRGKGCLKTRLVNFKQADLHVRYQSSPFLRRFPDNVIAM